MSLNLVNVAGAFQALADLFNDAAKETNTPAPAQVSKRPRGRPVKGEEQEAAAPTVPAQVSSTTPATPAVAEADPFEAPAPKVAAPPSATLDEVRAALTALKAAASQDIALGVLKSAGGADNLTDLSVDKYGVVVQAAKAKQAEYEKAPEPDPFEVGSAPVEKSVSLEDVKAAVVKAQKRTATDVVQKVVMEHGGKATNPDTGVSGPSLKALPAHLYAACIAAIEKLPTTK